MQITVTQMALKTNHVQSTDSIGLDLTLQQLAERSGLDKDLLLQRMASVLSNRDDDIVSILAQE